MAESIRFATEEDCSFIYEQAMEFYKYAGFIDKGLTLKFPSVVKFVQYLVKSQKAVILIAEKHDHLFGSMACLVHPWMFDESLLVATELWWWTKQDERNTLLGIKLYKSMIEELQKQQARLLIMVTADGAIEEKVKRFYKHEGFKHLEHHYIKELI